MLYEPSVDACVRRVSPVAVLRAVTCELGAACPRKAASTACDQPVCGRQARSGRTVYTGQRSAAPLNRDCVLTNTVPLVCLCVAGTIARSIPTKGSPGSVICSNHATTCDKPRRRDRLERDRRGSDRE